MVEKCFGNRGLPWEGLDSKIGRLDASMFEPDGFSCGVGSFRKCLECTNVKRRVKRNTDRERKEPVEQDNIWKRFRFLENFGGAMQLRQVKRNNTGIIGSTSEVSSLIYLFSCALLLGFAAARTRHAK